MKSGVPAFGPFRFDTASRTLWRGEEMLPLGARAAALLGALLGAEGRVVSKADLIEAAWPKVFVEESNLAVQIAGLRKALGTRPDGAEWIVTVPRTGYRMAIESPRGASRPSLAVLPFVNMSNDPEQDYFADGMVEDLITAFSRFRGIAVVARQSTFAYKNRAIDIREVASQLGVRYLLEGSIRRYERHMRVNAQLIDGDNGAHRWATKLDGDVENVFDFQDRITDAVVGLIVPHIQQAEIERARRKRPDSMDAYDLYLQALPFMSNRRYPGKVGYSTGLALLERALAVDPDFAAALALAAWFHAQRFGQVGVVPSGVDDAARAVEYSNRALAIDSGDAMVLLAAGVVRMSVMGDGEGGFALVRRAEELNPGSTLILNTLAYAQFLRGEYDAAEATWMRSLRLTPGDPGSLWAFHGLSRVHLSAGRVEEALVWAQRSVDTPTVAYGAHGVLAACYVHLGRLEEARGVARRALSLAPDLTIAAVLGANARPEGRDRLLAEGMRAAGLPEGEPRAGA